jgi:hypothetical protein
MERYLPGHRRPTQIGSDVAASRLKPQLSSDGLQHSLAQSVIVEFGIGVGVLVVRITLSRSHVRLGQSGKVSE